MGSPVVSANYTKCRGKITLVQKLFAQSNATCLCLPREWTIATCLMKVSQDSARNFALRRWRDSSCSPVSLEHREQPLRQTSNPLSFPTPAAFTGPTPVTLILPTIASDICQRHSSQSDSRETPINDLSVHQKSRSFRINRGGRPWNGYELELDERRWTPFSASQSIVSKVFCVDRGTGVSRPPGNNNVQPVWAKTLARLRYKFGDTTSFRWM
jgi:hypothetical protein